MTAIQIAMRSVICAMKYLLAPYMVASIIDPEDNSFGTWVRSIGGDLIANFCQIYFTYFVLILCNSSSIQRALGDDWIGIFAKIALFIGGLLAIQEIPNVISQFFGSSGQSMMETMRETMMMGSMLFMTGGTALKGATLAIGAGRKVAGKASSMKDAYTSAGGGIEGLKNAGQNATEGLKDKFNHSKNGDHVDDIDNHRKYGSPKYKQKKEDSVQQKESSMKSSKLDMPSYIKKPKNIPDQFHNDGDGKTYIAPDYQNDDDDESYLDAAKYYGIENAETMDKDELKKELDKRGYKYSSMKNYKSSFNSESYKTNMKNIKKRKGKGEK